MSKGANRDKLICHGDEGNEATEEQINFLKEQKAELTMSQIIIPELVDIAGFDICKKCYECVDFENRFDFVQVKVELTTYSEQYKYYSDNNKPDEYCKCCKRSI